MFKEKAVSMNCGEIFIPRDPAARYFIGKRKKPLNRWEE
jgi:hypothetical protein